MKDRVLRSIVLTGTLLSLIFIGGTFLGYSDLSGWHALNAMIGLVSIVCFFGVLAFPGGWSEGKGFSEGRVRFAITSTLVMLYVVYFATTIFWFNTPEAKLVEGEIPKQLLTTLSDMLKIVVPFYFGATAATEIMKSRPGTAPADSKS